MDRLTRVALDTSRDERVRTAAIAALSDLDASTLQPLWASLKQDPSAAVRRHVDALAKRSARSEAVRDPAEELNAVAEGGLPDDPAAVRDALVQAANRVALPRVHRILERIREREAAEPGRPRRVGEPRKPAYGVRPAGVARVGGGAAAGGFSRRARTPRLLTRPSRRRVSSHRRAREGDSPTPAGQADRQAVGCNAGGTLAG